MRGLARLVLALALAAGAPVLAQVVPPTCPTAEATLCAECRNCGVDHVFTVQGITMRIKFEDTKSLKIQCEGTSAKTQPLEERSVPVFRSGVLVRYVTVVGCPRAGSSYGALLAALNVSFPADTRPQLRVEKLRPQGNLTRAHFANLSSFAVLELLEVGPLSLTFLRDLTLKRLVVADSPILEHTLSESFDENSTLANISLRNTTLSRVPAEVLALPALRILKVLESESESMELARPGPGRALAPLRILQVDAADEEVMSEWSPPAAEEVTLVRWAATEPKAVPECGRLESLTVKSPRATALPERWVGACPRLARLEVMMARGVRELPATLLAGAANLTEFLFTNGALASLPRDLFAQNPRLATIDLTDNHLQILPSAAFYYQRATLQVLQLGHNRLTTVLAAGLGDLPALTTLVLADNTHLTDNCGGQPIREGIFIEHKGESGLSKYNMSNLRELDVRNTSVRVICKDWRVNLKNLKTLDLRYTKINRLTSEDLQYSWSDVEEGSVVRLEHTPLAELEYGPGQYAEDKARRGARRVRVTVGGPEARLPCDCDVYWPATALLDGVGPLRLGRDFASLWCNSTTPQELDRPQVDSLLCERREQCAGVPASCRCGIRALLGNRTLLRVECAAKGLDEVPRLVSLPTGVAVDLLLADNNITDLHLEDLPPDIKTFDLRNNTLERVEERAVVALAAAAARGARVLLAGGRLACGCGAAPALRALLALQPRPELTCDTGEPVAAALAALRCEEPPRSALLGTTLGVVALLAVLGGMLFALPATRRRLKDLLGTLRDEKPHRFDLFLTFGAGCERQALEVCARLEPRYAVCLQERDWVPPALIATCLAESVAASRRTLALATAQWAAALDAPTAEGAALATALRSRRLLAVLLEPPPAGALRGYLARHPRAALRYSDPDFWQKLSAALPSPAPPSPPSPPDRADVVSNV